LFLDGYTQNKDLLYHPLLHLNEFLIGNLAALAFLRFFNQEGRKSYLWQIAVVSVLIYGCLYFADAINFHNGLLAILYAFFIVLLAASQDRFTNFFKKKVFVALGEISYAVYILQFPVWVLLSDFRLKKYFYLDSSAGPDLKFVFRLVFLILVSAICYYLFELPAKKFLLQKKLIVKPLGYTVGN
jgi:peptidoglycan/LPS O-acetylase OafA/YrhL